MRRKRIKEINFYDRYYEDLQKDKSRQKLLITIAPGAALLLIVLVVFTVLKIQGAVKSHEIKEIEDYIYSPSISLEYTSALKLKEERDKVASEYDSISGVKNSIASYPKMHDELLQEVQACLVTASLQMWRYNASQGALYLTITAKSAKAMPPIIRLLKSTGKFSTVAYKGYQLEGGTGYGAAIGCKLFAPKAENNNNVKEQNNEETQ